jgi:hypothetical protein
LFRQALRDEAPAIRDAVLDSFAFEPAALKNVASHDTLDRIATNAVALRLGDQALARDVYTDLRDQVIRSPERWRDVDVDVSLSPWTAGPVAGRGSMLVATVRWEYKVIPAQSTMRFACVADIQEYRELLRDPTMFDKSGGINPASPDVFELVQFSVDGKDKKIRQVQRPDSQIYTVSLGKDTADKEVTVVYTFRVLAQRHSHLLPTRTTCAGRASSCSTSTEAASPFASTICSGCSGFAPSNSRPMYGRWVPSGMNSRKSTKREMAIKSKLIDFAPCSGLISRRLRPGFHLWRLIPLASIDGGKRTP